MKSSRVLIALLSVIAAAVVAVAVTLIAMATGDGDDADVSDDMGEPSKSAVAYSDAEWHWAEGWCTGSLGGIEGVDLWSSERPDGFTECVQTQLPAAAEGIKAAQADPEDVDAVTPLEDYCTYSAPPAVADDYDRAWEAFDLCMLEEFGVETDTAFSE